MKQKLFGTSGVRGIVNVDLTPEITLQIASAVAKYTDSGRIIVGHDTRTSASMLEHSLVAGLLAGGCSVYTLGLVPTPVLAYLTREIKADAGIMITASHNPPEYNGIKLFSIDSMAFDEEKQNQIGKIVENKNFKRADWQNIKQEVKIDETYRYIDAIQKTVTLKRQWKIVLDTANGATSNIAPTLFRKLGCKVTAINSQPDGFFPGRSPEPNAESLQSLCQIVKQLKADAGIAYDGDGDRMVAIDEKGKICPFDQILAAYASYVIKKNKGGTVVTTVEASMCIEKMIKQYNGKVKRTKVGDVNVAIAVKNSKAIFGGEPCGAWIHPKYHYCPDGILSSILLLKALEEEPKLFLSKFVSRAPLYPMIRESVACPNNIKSKVMDKLEKIVNSTFPKIKEKLTIDGLHITLENGWVLIRSSGTEPLIRVTVEAETADEAKEIMENGIKSVKKLVKEVVK
jgi:phosphoglucosamine mutase